MPRRDRHGASSGLGAAFVRLLDESLPPEIALWLIARNERSFVSLLTVCNMRRSALRLILRMWVLLVSSLMRYDHQMARYSCSSTTLEKVHPFV